MWSDFSLNFSMKPSFAVILTSYRRPDLAERAVSSVFEQTDQNWRLIIVIDDAESDYSQVRSMVEGNAKVTLLTNRDNLGKNASVNRALERLKSDGFFGYAVYLDDDDWLAEDCLQTFSEAITKRSGPAWLVSQRAHCITGESFAENKAERDIISYPRDMLLFRRFTGETTHCIDLARTEHCRFPARIKNAEEWLYFASVAKAVGPFVYIPKAGTYSAGYPSDGLTKRARSRGERFARNRTVIKEVFARRLFSPYVLTYLIGRIVRSLIKRA